jgi:hypothetical protein
VALGDAWQIAGGDYAKPAATESTESTESFQPHFLGDEQIFGKNECPGNYISSGAPTVKTFRTFRTFRIAAAQQAAGREPGRVQRRSFGLIREGSMKQCQCNHDPYWLYAEIKAARYPQKFREVDG